jgi:hypothetical protein
VAWLDTGTRPWSLESQGAHHGLDRAAVASPWTGAADDHHRDRPHKHSHTAVAVDQCEQSIGQLTVLAGPQATARLLAWATQWPERRWAVESARGLGYHLAQQLVGTGEQVSDVHAKLATRVRLLDRGHGRKTDQADARSVALVALRTPTLTWSASRTTFPRWCGCWPTVATSSTRNADG